MRRRTANGTRSWTVSLDQLEFDPPDPDVASEDAGGSDEDLWQLVGRLDEPLREVVHLRYVEGMSCGQIARVVGASPIAIRGRLHRAYQSLRRMLRENEK